MRNDTILKMDDTTAEQTEWETGQSAGAPEQVGEQEPEEERETELEEEWKTEPEEEWKIEPEEGQETEPEVLLKERWIDHVLQQKYQIRGISFKAVDAAFGVCLFLIAFMIRWKLMPIQSADYYGFLEQWMQSIRENGGIFSLGIQISNYTSPYMYIMTLLSYVSSNDLYALKLVSVFFDYMAAIAVFKILYHMTGQVRKSMLGMACLLLAPAVVIDGAYWCQCDIIYTSFLLYAFYYFLKDDSKKSMIFMGIAFSFKLQALFLLPFFIIMWAKKRTIKLRHLLYLPLIYVISAVPAWLMGRSLKELLMIYLDQSGTYPWGTLEYPNIYALLGEAMPDMRHAAEVSGAGTLMMVILMGCLAYYLYDRKIHMTDEFLVTLALFSVALIVYTLPHMHERYGILIDLFAVIYGVYRVKRLPVTCGFSLVSVMIFMPYLIAVDILPLQYIAIGQLGLIVYVGYDLYRQIQQLSEISAELPSEPPSESFSEPPSEA